MFGARFYHGLTKKYVAIFGTLFNEIRIARPPLDGEPGADLLVPINYGPTEKFLMRREQDPDHAAPAIVLPRMAFELSSYSYDGSRRLNDGPHWTRQESATAGLVNMAPAPYNLEFQLFVMTKTLEDGNKILEQVLPYFTPVFTVTARLVTGIDRSYDVPVVLTGVSKEDNYEGSVDEGRVITWTLNFTMKAWFFGPTLTKKVIKFTEVEVFTRPEMPEDGVMSRVKVWPGVTADGRPTTDPRDAVPYIEVDPDDDWASIVVVE